MEKEFDIQEYMTKGVERVVADAARATLKNPRESAFMLGFAKATVSASKKRKKAEKNEYGQWMEFETITYAPIDLEGIDKAYLNPDDVKQLNAYHKMVFEKLSPYFEGEELEWLGEVTREI